MPSKGRKFITEFLIPNLNAKKFGSRLKWLDAEKKIFQMQWNHKAACDWKESDAAVFAEWDKHKGHYKPDDKEYFTKSKQRFRAVLYKFISNGHITELSSKDKNTKIYCIGSRESIPNPYELTAKNEKRKNVNDNIAEKITVTDPEELVMDLSSFANNNHMFEYEDAIFPDYPNGIKEEIVIESEEKIVTDDENNTMHFQLSYDDILNASKKNNYRNVLTQEKEISKMKKTINKQLHTLYIDLVEVDASFLNNDNDSKQSSFSYTSHLYDENKSVMWYNALDKVELLDEEDIENQKLMEETPDSISYAFL